MVLNFCSKRVDGRQMQPDLLILNLSMYRFLCHTWLEFHRFDFDILPGL